MATALDILNNQVRGFTSLSWGRQIGLVVAVAAALTLAISLVWWLLKPEYAVMYPNLPDQESAQVLEALERLGVMYRLDPTTGAIEVQTGQIHEARLRLANEGLPRASGFGFELLQEDQGIGTSRQMEEVRRNRALEGELARSVATLNSVESARVHLALPRDSVFVRDRVKPSASVLLTLHPGRVLNEQRVAGIVHLVSSSITELEPEHVTVVDQRGRLLTQLQSGNGMDATAQQMEFTRLLEQTYAQRIVDLLAPVVGEEGLRAQVSAELDFSQIERTTEVHDPETIALRSEQLNEQERRDSEFLTIPGALTNQPPEAGMAVDLGAEDEEAENPPLSRSRSSVRNFEVDRTISHVREAPGAVRRLSVAVVVDHQEQLNAAGELERLPLEQAELEQLTTLVQDAVGFDAERGDSVNVMTASFRPVAAPPEPEPVPIWEQPWFLELIRPLLAVFVVLLIALTVIRPLLRGLADKGRLEEELELARLAPPQGADEDALSLGHDAREALTGPQSSYPHYDTHLEMARNMVREDPKRVAQLMKMWILTDGAN